MRSSKTSIEPVCVPFSETMREALLVNPYDVEKTADQIHRALTMPMSERRTRMDALQAREQASDVHAWVDGFLRAASSAATGIA